MKLSLIKNQTEAKDHILWRSPILYSLSARVELTDDETELMNKYKLKSELLSAIQKDDKHVQNVTMETLIVGCIFEHEHVDRLLAIEQEIKNSCQIFKAYMEMRKNFYGKEIIEY